MPIRSNLTEKIICSILVVLFVLGGLNLLTDKCAAKTIRANMSLNKALIGYWVCTNSEGSVTWKEGYYFNNDKMIHTNDLWKFYTVYDYEIIDVNKKSGAITIYFKANPYKGTGEGTAIIKFSKDKSTCLTDGLGDVDGHTFRYKGKNKPALDNYNCTN